MVQGNLKKSARPVTTGKPKPLSGGARKPKVSKKPQKAKTTSADKMQKKFSSGLINKTEKMLGERAGHLELIGLGKKAKKDRSMTEKGGSRKFG